MMTLLGSVLGASLLGNLHCAGMCGPFAALAGGGGGAAVWRTQVAYHLGRLTTYVLLGALAGGLGHALNLGGAWAGVQRGAALLAGAVMIAWALLTVLPLLGVRRRPIEPPAWLRRLTLRGHERAMLLRPTARAAATGLLTTLLPCGWLYAFVIAAAGSASPGVGALVMAAFWLGTLPALLAIGALATRLRAFRGRALSVIAATALLGLGVLTLLDRARLPVDLWALSARRAGDNPSSGAVAPACCDEHN